MQRVTFSTLGIDIGKNCVHAVGLDDSGHLVYRRRLTHAKLIEQLANKPRLLVGMEACPGSNYLGRRLAAFGHDVRLIPAQYVKPYVKTNKNDFIDAAAIAEAVTRPTMRHIPIKSTEQLDLQTLHRVRDRLVHQRTGLISQIRSFLLEYGVVLPSGVAAFKRDYERTLIAQSDKLTPRLQNTLARLRDELADLERRLAEASREIEDIASRDDRARRLMTVPGIGPLAATAFLAAVGDARRFRRGRDLAAWLGLVPRQYSTGGTQKLLGISKRGNSYLRRLLIHGARSCVLHLHRDRDRLGQWLDQLEARAHRNKAVVALANKLARIAWALLVDSSKTYERRPKLVAGGAQLA
jgi:transposase